MYVGGFDFNSPTMTLVCGVTIATWFLLYWVNIKWNLTLISCKKSVSSSSTMRTDNVLEGRHRQFMMIRRPSQTLCRPLHSRLSALFNPPRVFVVVLRPLKNPIHLLWTWKSWTKSKGFFWLLFICRCMEQTKKGGETKSHNHTGRERHKKITPCT